MLLFAGAEGGAGGLEFQQLKKRVKSKMLMAFVDSFEIWKISWYESFGSGLWVAPFVVVPGFPEPQRTADWSGPLLFAGAR